MCRRWRMESNPKNRAGNNLIEFSLLMPWFVFLFVGVYDFGFYDYSLIALQDGLRVAAINAAQNSSLAANSATACIYVLAALKNLPNIGTSVTSCSASPLTVTSA
ncbi:MAG: pilus assembly protein, partial [Acidobacteriota bacterium]|nr:pilus assembly protein [Acidobacteriota bacterium]